MSISHIRIKIKDFARLVDRRDVWAILTICLSGISGYCIGRLGPLKAADTPIRIEMRGIATSSEPIILATSTNPVKIPVQAVDAPGHAQRGAGKYVASKSGSKYHLTTCPGARTISEANKIWFETKEEAEKAGYGPAANCKGI